MIRTMKLKNILSIAIAAVMAVGVSSCEDMFRVDSKIVDYEENYKLDQTTDTVYMVMGIIKKMQAIADRSVILGEIRGDLVQVTEHANESLAELYKYDLSSLSSTNKYNKPVDYYAVINNCNFFLNRADTAKVKNGKNVFIKEFIPVWAFRAWTYMQLAQVYGKVYYFDKPMLSGDQADEDSMEPHDIREIAQLLLDDFTSNHYERFLDTDVANFGNLGGDTNGDGTQSSTHKTTDILIPLRLILADLYLWAEDYPMAAKYYHDYLSYNMKAVPTTTASVMWFGSDFRYLGEDTYSKTFGKNMKSITYIPMESDQYSGTISELPEIFNSTEDNNYYCQLTRSQALTQLSARQNYCFMDYNLRTDWIEPIYMPDKEVEDDVLRRGDLRLQSILEVKNSVVEENQKAIDLSTSRQTLIKINAEKICLYRDDVVYLRLAEALNRCGMPQMAFKILEEGLCKTVIDSLSEVEKQKARDLQIPEVLTFNENKFKRYQLRTIEEDTHVEDGITITAKNVTYQSPSDYNTMGIHSRGCGDAYTDTTYVIPACATLMDSIRAVEELILNEMALETCFEGYRFGDLMRISMHRAADAGYDGAGGFADNAFFAKHVAARESATMNDPYAGVEGTDLYKKLLGNGTGFNRNWFLPLPTSSK